MTNVARLVTALRTNRCGVTAVELGATRFLLALRTNIRGVTAVEYGIMASLIAIALIAAMATFGTALKAEFGTLATTLNPPASK